MAGLLSRAGSSVREFFHGAAAPVDGVLLTRDQFADLMLHLRSQAISGGSSPPVNVTEEFAMNVTVYYTCLRILAGSVAQLPIKMYQVSADPQGHDEEVRDHPIAEFLRQPQWCPWMTRFDQIALMLTHRLSWGNSYNRITWDRDNNPVEIETIHPANVQPQWSDRFHDRRGRAKLIYRVRQDGQTVEDFDGDILVFRNLSTTGLNGVGHAQYGQQSIQLAWHQENIALEFCANSAKPSIVVKVPGMVIGDRAKFMADLKKQHKSGDPLVLEHGGEASNIQIPFSAAQLLESRQYQGRVIANRFGIPPHLFNDTDGSKYDNVDKLDNMYGKYTLTPIVKSIELELARKLLTAEEQRQFYFTINLDALLRGSVKDRAEAVKSYVGWAKINEIRRIMDLKAIPEGDTLYQLQILPKDQQPAPETPEPPAAKPATAPPVARISDPAHAKLIRHNVEALQTAERIAIERACKTPAEFPAKVAKVFSDSQARYAERFGTSPELVAVIQHRRDELLRCASEADLAAAVEACLSGPLWRSEALLPHLLPEDSNG